MPSSYRQSSSTPTGDLHPNVANRDDDIRSRRRSRRRSRPGTFPSSSSTSYHRRDCHDDGGDAGDDDDGIESHSLIHRRTKPVGRLMPLISLTLARHRRGTNCDDDHEDADDDADDDDDAGRLENDALYRACVRRLLVGTMLIRPGERGDGIDDDIVGGDDGTSIIRVPRPTCGGMGRDVSSSSVVLDVIRSRHVGERSRLSCDGGGMGREGRTGGHFLVFRVVDASPSTSILPKGGGEKSERYVVIPSTRIVFMSSVEKGDDVSDDERVCDDNDYTRVGGGR